MTEDDVQEARRQRLREWIAEHGGLTKVAGTRNLRPSYVSYLSQIVNGYSIGSRGARTCESRLGMPANWLDQLSTGAEIPARATAVHPLVPPAPSVADVVQRLAEILESMPDEQLPAVVEKLTTLGKSPDSQKARAALIIALGGTAPAVASSKRTGT